MIKQAQAKYDQCLAAVEELAADPFTSAYRLKKARDRLFAAARVLLEARK